MTTPFHRYVVQQDPGGTTRIHEETRKSVTDLWMFSRYATELGHFETMSDAFTAAKQAARALRLEEARKRPVMAKIFYPPGVYSDPLRAELPRQLPREWTQIVEAISHEYRADLDGKVYACFHRVTDDLRVIVDVGATEGQRFLRVGALYPERMPTWTELCAIKDLFIGPERYAFQVHPPTSQHVSISHNMLHLWCPLSGWPFPDLRPLM
jgi:hypothetical protein